MASILTVNNETKNSMTRVTQDNRHLTYELNVIQQPERARACGSGAKSSADRRPVDPPPVVELKIFEGEREPKTDVTFSHNANFFLFTTLENARPIAKGRVSIQPPTIPVLTGSPVAGMAYLDRPSAAGYFIFPDLSVRHEGMYRLSFSLFEELKEPKDADAESPEGSPKSSDKVMNSNPMAPRAHVHFRLEVKSKPFAVFSAKKFPGLSESTPLSRTVAEQGCRVRIRRDVRMRRRDKGDGFQDYDDDNGYGQPEQYGTPQHVPERPRSISHGSIESQSSFAAARRPSLQDGYFGAYPQGPPPPPISSTSSYSCHLNFGGATTPGQYPTPTFPHPQVPHQVHQNYVQNNNGYPYPPNLPSRQMSISQNYNYHQPQQQLSSYPSYAQTPPYTESNDFRPLTDYKRANGSMQLTPQQPNSQQSMNSYSQNSSTLQQASYVQQPHSSSRTATPIDTNGHVPPPQLPPLRTDNICQQALVDPKYETKSPASAIPRPIMPSPSIYAGYNPYDSSLSQSANSISGRNPKRPFDNVFDTHHLEQPIHGGMRPSSLDQGRDRPQIETDTGELEDYNDIEQLKSKTLVYKRADGSQQAKKCPSPIRASVRRRH